MKEGRLPRKMVANHDRNVSEYLLHLREEEYPAR
jgi:hypothetical protein